MRRSANLMKVYRELYREFGPQGWWPVARTKRSLRSARDGTLGDERFEIMIGAILTQNTAWKNVEKAIGNLIKARALDPKKIVQMPSRTLEQLIRPAGYFRQKTKKLKIFSKWYLARQRSLGRLRTHKLRKELLGLWGIGPETADSILLYAFRRPVFVIDTYTKRLVAAGFSRRSKKATQAKACDYHELQKTFTDALPRSVKLYNEFHALIVAWGKHQR